MAVAFNVDTDAVIDFTNRLETLTRSAFPAAVRETLNSLAFDVKQGTMPKEAEQAFESRKKNFFKKSSRVNMARGFEVDHMQSEVGFLPFPDSEQAVENLNEQERGGTIEGRAFIPIDSARVSKSNKRLVSKKNRISSIRNIANIKNARGASKGQRIIKTVFHAGEKGHVLIGETLFRVEKLTRGSGRTKFKLKALYNYKKGRSVKVKATHFMEKSAVKSSLKANDFYIKAGQKQFERHFK